MSVLREGTVTVVMDCCMGHVYTARARFTPVSATLVLEQPERAYCPTCRNPDRDVSRQLSERGKEPTKAADIRIRMEEL